MAEATNELAFLVTGAYGKPVAKVDGRADPRPPAVEVRLQVDQIDRQVHLHRRAAGRISGSRSRRSEYGFWANVNPDVPHPRWSQATERDIATGETHPDAALQRLRRIRRRPLCRAWKNEPLYM